MHTYPSSTNFLNGNGIYISQVIWVWLAQFQLSQNQRRIRVHQKVQTNKYKFEIKLTIATAPVVRQKRLNSNFELIFKTMSLKLRMQEIRIIKIEYYGSGKQIIEQPNNDTIYS